MTITANELNAVEEFLVWLESIDLKICRAVDVGSVMGPDYFPVRENTSEKLVTYFRAKTREAAS
jgi:hypothetical protein